MYTIGQLAKIVGVSTKALRLYEEKGLIHPERSDENNYRLYGDETKAVLQKIIMMKFLGFSLEHIKVFLKESETMSAEEAFEEQKRLPSDIHITCVDLHNTWADSLEEDVHKMEQEGEIPKGCFSFRWGNMEEMKFRESYDCIFFNHTAVFMKNGVKMLHTFSECLDRNGVFICTWGGISAFEQVREWIREYGTDIEEIENSSSKWELWIKQWEENLNSVFPAVEKRIYEIELFFDTAEDCYEFILRRYKELSAMLERERQKLIRFLRTKQDKNGKLVIKKDTYLYRCTK